MDNRFLFSKLFAYIIMLFGGFLFVLGAILILFNIFPYTGSADLALYGLISMAGVALVIVGIALMLLHRIEENTHLMLKRLSRGIFIAGEQAAARDTDADGDTAADSEFTEDSDDEDPKSDDEGVKREKAAPSAKGYVCADCGCPVRKGRERCPICGSERLR